MSKKLPLLVAPKAGEDIQSLQNFLVLRNEEEAFPLFTKRIDTSMRLLQEFPELGEYRENIQARVLAVPRTKYLVVFRVKDGVLQILRIYHTSQKWKIDL